MSSVSIGIIKADFHEKHSSSWSKTWQSYCEEEHISHQLIDWRGLDGFEQMLKHDILLWHFSHYSQEEMMFARNILKALKASGCRVYPDDADSDHFDDKVAQANLFRALNIQTPNNFSLYSQAAVNDWIVEVGSFPIVAKLRAGSGASNVKLLESPSDLRSYAKKMFSTGFNSKPSARLKIVSNLKSTISLSQFVKRLKRAPEFLFSWSQASKRSNEKGYVYLQEFIPNVNYDLKVVVVGDQLSFICRGVRPGDFRASGSGSLFYDHSLMDQSVIDAAFNAADAMQSSCTGFDMIKDPRSEAPIILEVSYGFSHLALLDAGGYYERNGVWRDKPLNAPQALLKNLLNDMPSKK